MRIGSIGYERVISSIYENLLSDEPWRDAVDATRALFSGSNMAFRITHGDLKRPDTIFASCVKPAAFEGVQQMAHYRYGPVFPQHALVGQVKLFRWEDVLPQSPALDLIRQSHSFWMMMLCFEIDDNIEFQLAVDRPADLRQFGSEDVTLLKTVSTHFQRALRLRRDALSKCFATEFQGHALDRMSIGGMLIEQGGKTTLLNDTAINLTAARDGIMLSRGEIHAVNRHENVALQSAIREVLSSNLENPIQRAITISRSTHGAPLGLIISGRRSISALSGEPEMKALMLIRNNERACTMDVALVRQLFMLTPTEASVAAGVADGRSLRELAEQLGIQYNTVRAHLRSVFSKLNVSRQSELTQLLANSIASDSRLH